MIELGKKMALYTAFFSMFISFAINGAMAGIMYYASVLYKNKEISIGNVTSFLLYMI